MDLPSLSFPRVPKKGPCSLRWLLPDFSAPHVFCSTCPFLWEQGSRNRWVTSYPGSSMPWLVASPRVCSTLLNIYCLFHEACNAIERLKEMLVIHLSMMSKTQWSLIDAGYHVSSACCCIPHPLPAKLRIKSSSCYLCLESSL